MLLVNKFFTRLYSLPDQLQKDLVTSTFYRTYVWSNHVYLYTAILHFCLIFFFAYLGIRELALFNILSVLLWISAIVFNLRGKITLGYIIGNFEVLIHVLLCTVFIGWESGFHYYLLCFAVAIFPFGIWSTVTKALLTAGNSLAYIATYYYSRNYPPLKDLSTFDMSLLAYANMLSFCLILAFMGLYIAVAINRAEEETEREHKKSEALLLNILPKSIANKLKSGTKIIADNFDNISILFLDIVEFTPRSEKITAQKVVGFLNELFTRFDNLTEKYGLEKIKTIGDAYMVAAGIPEPCIDHAERLAYMAIDIQRMLEEYNVENNDNVKVRIGINSGSAVAGVIGKKKFAYDIWGDTVNTASRMEAYGEPNRIQVSEATYHILKNKFVFNERGLIDIKGKGKLRTYYLVSEKRQDFKTSEV